MHILQTPCDGPRKYWRMLQQKSELRSTNDIDVMDLLSKRNLQSVFHFLLRFSKTLAKLIDALNEKSPFRKRIPVNVEDDTLPSPPLKNISWVAHGTLMQPARPTTAAFSIQLRICKVSIRRISNSPNYSSELLTSKPILFQQQNVGEFISFVWRLVQQIIYF